MKIKNLIFFVDEKCKLEFRKIIISVLIQDCCIAEWNLKQKQNNLIIQFKAQRLLFSLV